MRALLVSLSDYTYPDNRGQAAELARRLESVDVVTGDVPTLWSSAVSAGAGDGFRLHVLEPRLRGSWATTVLPGLGRIAESARPDVIHVTAEPWQLVAVQAVRAAGRLGVPVGVQFCENGPALRGRGGSLRSLVGSWTLSRCAYAIGWAKASTAVARQLAPHIRVETMPSVGIAATPPELVSAFAQEIPRWFGPAPEGVKLAFAGRLEPQKGIQDFMAACDLLSARRPLRAAMAGGGGLEPAVRSWAGRRPWARFHGVIGRSEAVRLLACADFLLAPSHTTPKLVEQFGRAAAEAMGVGTPVVAYDSGALPEVVGDGGVIVPEGDVHALVEALEAQLSASASDRQALGARARAQAESLTDAALAERLCSIWESLERPAPVGGRR